MSLVFYNKKILSDIAIVILGFGKTTRQIIKDNFVFLFSDDRLIGLNILNASQTISNLKSVFSVNKEIKNIIKSYGYKFDDFPQITIVKVLDINKHPKSDKLYVANVTDFFKNYSIITNIKNIEVDQKMILAKNYSILPNGQWILPKTILGIKSDGMFCLKSTLQISDKTNDFKDNVDNLDIGSEFII